MRHRTILGAALVGLALSGCAATARTPSPPPTVPAVRLIGSEPVLRAEDLGDYGAILPSAFFEADGVLHAYLVGFGDAIGDQEVFHATSEDGSTWEVDGNQPMRELGLDLSPPGPIPASVLPDPDGGWLMYLWGAPAPETRGAILWRARSESPGGPWVADAEPTLALGETGAWDDVALDFPAVVADGGGYRMFYSAVGTATPQTAAIGQATSADGVAWQREEAPVIQPGDCFPGESAAAPRILAAEGGWLMLFNADRRVGAARSGDGVAWSCAADEPILTAADVPGSGGIHTFAMARHGERAFLLVESLVDGGSEVWLAELVPAG